MGTMTSALEHTVYFLCEQRTEPYLQYGGGVAQLKNALCAESHLQRQALPDIERDGT